MTEYHFFRISDCQSKQAADQKRETQSILWQKNTENTTFCENDRNWNSWLLLIYCFQAWYALLFSVFWSAISRPKYLSEQFLLTATSTSVNIVTIWIVFDYKNLIIKKTCDSLQLYDGKQTCPLGCLFYHYFELWRYLGIAIQTLIQKISG